MQQDPDDQMNDDALQHHHAHAHLRGLKRMRSRGNGPGLILFFAFGFVVVVGGVIINRDSIYEKWQNMTTPKFEREETILREIDRDRAA